MVTMALTLLFFHWENLRKFPENLRKTFGKLRRRRKITEMQMFFPGSQTNKNFLDHGLWTVWSCGIRLYVRESTFGVLTVHADFKSDEKVVKNAPRKI
jgi:hypothetical protein